MVVGQFWYMGFVIGGDQDVFIFENVVVVYGYLVGFFDVFVVFEYGYVGVIQNVVIDIVELFDFVGFVVVQGILVEMLVIQLVVVVGGQFEFFWEVGVVGEQFFWYIVYVDVGVVEEFFFDNCYSGVMVGCYVCGVYVVGIGIDDYQIEFVR